jgi:hypothetical protein
MARRSFCRRAYSGPQTEPGGVLAGREAVGHCVLVANRPVGLASRRLRGQNCGASVSAITRLRGDMKPAGKNKAMSNATTQLFMTGLLLVLPVSASNPNGGRGLNTSLSGLAAGHCEPVSLPIVVIYLHDNVNVSLYQRSRAILVATRAFRSTGVALDWRDGAGSPERKASGCGLAEIIELQIDPTADENRTSNALAYAMPMRASGIRIHVIYDRVAGISREVPNLLGYVLAHEIGHVLQGVARHSDTGILKAKWSGRDYSLMAAFALTFSPEDDERIRNHFNRQHGATDGTNAPAVLIKYAPGSEEK